MIIGIGIPFGRRKVGGGSTNTARTQAFLTATGITDATIISALNAMDTSLISAGLLPSGTGAGKIKALYPIVGGTAATHKFNFVNPLDTNAAFRLTFNGGWTHSANGMTPNGTNGYANSFFNPQTELDDFDYSYGAYYRTQISEVTIEGNFNTVSLSLSIRGATGRFYSAGPFGNLDDLGTSTLGLFAVNRLANNNAKAYFNSNQVDSDTSTTSLIPPSLNMFVGALNNNGSPSFYISKQIAFEYYGVGLTNAEHLSLYNSVQTLQTTLGRQV
jgi:hypothetical protein